MKQDKEPKNQVAVKEETALAEVPQEAWGTENTDSSDILIPRISVLQAMSDFVIKKRLGQVGDIVRSTDGKKLGDEKTPVHIIPFFSFKSWVVYERVGRKRNFKLTTAFGPENASWQREETHGQITIERDLVLNFFVLLADEVSDPTALPYLLNFRRTGYKTGQILATFFAKCREMKKPPAHRVFELSCYPKEGEEGVYYVPDLKEGKEATKVQLSKAFDWYKKLQATGHKIDDSDLRSEAEQPEVVDAKVSSASRF